jgi:hypothetical protein
VEPVGIILTLKNRFFYVERVYGSVIVDNGKSIRAIKVRSLKCSVIQVDGFNYTHGEEGETVVWL